VPAGTHQVQVRFDPHVSDGNLSLAVDGEVVAIAHHPRAAIFVALATAGARMLVGRDRGLPFNDDYEPPFPLTGAILHKLALRAGRPGAARPPAEIIETGTHAD
jgi:hypothetical protein